MNRKDFDCEDDLHLLNKQKTDNEKLPSQNVIQKNVNLYTKEKVFDFNLENGPFKGCFARNGGYVLAFSKNGFYSVFNSQNYQLNFERNLEEKIYDGKFLHNGLYTALALEKGVFIHDSQGIELHCVRDLKRPRMLEFLPYHFLLASAGDLPFLKYFDTSVGTLTADLYIKFKPTTMCQNPSNAVIHLGNDKGRVFLYSPAQKDYLMQINCHKTGITNIKVDRNGHNLITTGLDNILNIFDIRNTYKPIKSLKVKNNLISISEQNLLAVAFDDKITVLKNYSEVHSRYKANGRVSSLDFCPHEDILLVGHENGINSIIVPGSGDPIYDSIEGSPFMNNRERQNSEVKALLEKIPYDMISLNSFVGDLESNKNTMAEESKYYDPENKGALAKFHRSRR